MVDVGCMVVTGASGGIGLATAELGVQEGYRVWNVSRRKCPLDGVQNILCDLSVEKEVQEAVQGLIKAVPWGARMCVVHNASGFVADSVLAPDYAMHEALWRLNVLSPMRLNAALFPRMGEGSSVVFVSSTLGHLSVPDRASYSIAKHAMLALMGATCQDTLHLPIHTVGVCPGQVDTAMLPPKQIVGKYLLKPHEIARVILMAAQNPALNGAVLDAHTGQKNT